MQTVLPGALLPHLPLQLPQPPRPMWQEKELLSAEAQGAANNKFVLALSFFEMGTDVGKHTCDLRLLSFFRETSDSGRPARGSVPTDTPGSTTSTGTKQVSSLSFFPHSKLPHFQRAAAL